MTRTTIPRPTLLPGLSRRWRDRHTVQLGLDPARAVVLELADPSLARLLDLLDGEHTERAVLGHAVRGGIGEEPARALLDALREAGLLVTANTLFPRALPEPARHRLMPEAAAIALRGADATPAQVLRRRRGARIVVTGGGRLAAPVAIALADAGVGHVRPALAGRVGVGETTGGALRRRDLGRPRSAAVTDALRRAAPDIGTGPVGAGKASFVVHVGTDRPPSLLAAGNARHRRPHLMVDVRDGVAVIGPLVPAGGTPCLNCVDLHRQDRDPAWPTLAAQVDPDRVEPASAPTVLAAAGYAAAEVLCHLDGRVADTIGATVEIDSPGRMRRRSWSPHPECGCDRRPRGRARPAEQARPT